MNADDGSLDQRSKSVKEISGVYTKNIFNMGMIFDWMRRTARKPSLSQFLSKGLIINANDEANVPVYADALVYA